jgi:hypothetical protein
MNDVLFIINILFNVFLLKIDFTDIVVISEERSSNEQHRSSKPNMIQKSSNRKAILNDNDGLKKPNAILKARYYFEFLISVYFTSTIDRRKCYSCIHLSSTGVVMFALFTTIAIIVGVLTVYFTSSRPSMFFICFSRHL